MAGRGIVRCNTSMARIDMRVSHLDLRSSWISAKLELHGEHAPRDTRNGLKIRV
jgi:hypothetical protein